jgi:hypothetical protein
MLVFAALKAGHSHVKDLLERMEATTGEMTNTRSELYDRLRRDFLAQFEAEERVFYSVLGSRPETSDLVAFAREDHEIVLDLLEELGAIAPEAEEWLAAVKVLKDNVELHIEDEEGELFRRARALLRRRDAEKLGEQMAQGKRRLSPRTPRPPMTSIPSRLRAERHRGVGGIHLSLRQRRRHLLACAGVLGTRAMHGL